MVIRASQFAHVFVEYINIILENFCIRYSFEELHEVVVLAGEVREFEKISANIVAVFGEA